VTKNPVEWVKYHAAKMGFMLTTRLHAHWPAHGAASILLHQYLTSGEPLPNDDAELAVLAGGTLEKWQEVSAQVRSLFYVDDDGMLHQRELDDMLNEAADHLAWKRKIGSLGGKATAAANKVVPIHKKRD
jgi:uncharacterized protein YdaU (DUF1376 family)